jgi:hypothetical protein
LTTFFFGLAFGFFTTFFAIRPSFDWTRV